jgi:hypothetical protein
MAPGFKKPDGSDPFTLASTTTAGLVKKGVTVANATDAATVILRLNDLLTSLRTAGVIV